VIRKHTKLHAHPQDALVYGGCCFPILIGLHRGTPPLPISPTGAEEFAQARQNHRRPQKYRSRRRRRACRPSQAAPIPIMRSQDIVFNWRRFSRRRRRACRLEQTGSPTMRPLRPDIYNLIPDAKHREDPDPLYRPLLRQIAAAARPNRGLGIGIRDRNAISHLGIVSGINTGILFGIITSSTQKRGTK
jgi:hypothetical protein